MKLIPCDCHVVFFGYLCSTHLAESFSSIENLQDTVARYERGECKLFTFPGKGYLVLSWHSSLVDGSVYLEIEQAVGYHICTTEGIEAVLKLARETNCDRVVLTVRDKQHERLYSRIGFCVQFKSSDYPKVMELKTDVIQ